MATIAPRTLTAALVTIPANSSVIPNASTIGHAVGAGISIASGIVSWFCFDSHSAFPFLAPDNVHDREDHHPHHIHEVPIHRQDLDALGVLLSYISRGTSNTNTVARASRPTVT